MILLVLLAFDETQKTQIKERPVLILTKPPCFIRFINSKRVSTLRREENLINSLNAQGVNVRKLFVTITEQANITNPCKLNLLRAVKPYHLLL